ncbi:MAG TPA: hypothetical protein VHG33_11095, partial [Woeseiaceae bacterium]|nr:hypothetical protein [Woeseiaceae bacterium]
MASILLAALLQLDLDLKTGVANHPAEQHVLRILDIARRNVERTPESSTAEQAIHRPIEHERAPDEMARSEQGEKPDDSADSRVDPEPVRDWYALLKPSAKATVDVYVGREDLRASVWRETRSVMFQPGDEFGVIEEKPILSDIKFRQPVGVLGIGFTVGSCFIGIPIFGVPVE